MELSFSTQQNSRNEPFGRTVNVVCVCVCVFVKGCSSSDRRVPRGEVSSIPRGLSFGGNFPSEAPPPSPWQRAPGWPRSRARPPAHLAAAPPGEGAGLAARAGAGRDASSPGPARQVGPRLGSDPARAPPKARVGGRGSPGAARLCHRLTHRRKVALGPSPTSYFLPGAPL